MRVRYSITRWPFDGSVRHIAAVDPVEHCCGDMETAWDALIGFGEWANPACNKNVEVNLYQEYRKHEGVYADAFPIQFCPFCGNKITVEEVA